MSLNIPDSFVKVTSGITATVDINKLGNRQIPALIRFLESGLIKGNGIPAQIAVKIRSSYNLGIVHARTYGTSWCNLTEPDDFKALIVAAGDGRMRGITDHRFHHQKWPSDLELRKPSGWSRQAQELSLSLCSNKELHLRSHPEVEQLVSRLKSGEQTHIPINF